MKRRSLLVLGALAPVGLFCSRYVGARAAKMPLSVDYRERALQLNELAANIQTPADARRLVDFIAGLFSEEAPSGWDNRSLRNRIAAAEFAAVSEPEKGIPEGRLAEVWNAYVETIQGPEEQKVTPAELHNLRDSFLTTARVLWDRGGRNIWAVPSIYATLPDGELAPGCRAVESIRVLWDLANMPGNLRGARDRVSKGELASELFRKPAQSTGSPVMRGQVQFGTASNRIDVAERNYIRLHGNRAFRKAVMTMIEDTLG